MLKKEREYSHGMHSTNDQQTGFQARLRAPVRLGDFAWDFLRSAIYLN